MESDYLIPLDLADNIDAGFVAIVQQVLNNTLRHVKPQYVYVVLIDTWFDVKWLEFGSSPWDSELSKREKRLWLPHFWENRVLSSSYF